MFRPCLPSDVSAQADGQNHSGQQSADAADWQTVMASLAELGFQVQGEGTPAATDVVSAAQLRLRYWRRQLPCGDAGLTADEESGLHPQLTGVSDSQTNSQISALNGVPQPVAALEQTSVSETFVRERIRSIKSARECLLVCSCRRVLSAPGGRLTATERHVLREAEDHGF